MRNLILALLLPVVALAQAPSANTLVSGSISHADTVIVGGTNFGALASPAPWVWDQFEDGTPSASVSASSDDWATDGAHTSFIYSAAQAYSGSQSAAKATGGSGFHNIYNQVEHNSDEIYMTGWFLTSGWDQTDNDSGTGLAVKFNRVNCRDFGSPGVYNGPLSFNFGYKQYGTYPNAGSAITDAVDFDVFVIRGADNSGTWGTQNYPSEVADLDFEWNYATWIRFEHYVKLNTSPGTSDGLLATRMYGWESLSGSGYEFREGTCTLQIDTALYEMGSANGSASQEWYAYLDDAYCSGTPMRVELANNADFSLASHSEIQYTLSRTDTQVEFIVNTGGFASGDTVWVHVIGADNTPGTGLQVVVGSSGSGGSGAPDIQSATRSGGNAELTWLSGDGGPYMVWLQASGQDVRALATTDTTATLPMSSAATDVTVKDGTSQRRAHIAE